jgi:hypothetical protein
MALRRECGSAGKRCGLAGETGGDPNWHGPDTPLGLKGGVCCLLASVGDFGKMTEQTACLRGL